MLICCVLQSVVTRRGKAAVRRGLSPRKQGALAEQLIDEQADEGRAGGGDGYYGDTLDRLDRAGQDNHSHSHHDNHSHSTFQSQAQSMGQDDHHLPSDEHTYENLPRDTDNSQSRRYSGQLHGNHTSTGAAEHPLSTRPLSTRGSVYDVRGDDEEQQQPHSYDVAGSNVDHGSTHLTPPPRPSSVTPTPFQPTPLPANLPWGVDQQGRQIRGLSQNGSISSGSHVVGSVVYEEPAAAQNYNAHRSVEPPHPSPSLKANPRVWVGVCARGCLCVHVNSVCVCAFEVMVRQRRWIYTGLCVAFAPCECGLIRRPHYGDVLCCVLLDAGLHIIDTAAEHTTTQAAPEGAISRSASPYPPASYHHLHWLHYLAPLFGTVKFAGWHGLVF